MKKLIVALLMAGLFTFTLGCGGGSTTKSTSSTAGGTGGAGGSKSESKTETTK